MAIEMIEVGTQGPRGPQGLQGPEGTIDIPKIGDGVFGVITNKVGVSPNGFAFGEVANSGIWANYGYGPENNDSLIASYWPGYPSGSYNGFTSLYSGGLAHGQAINNSKIYSSAGHSFGYARHNGIIFSGQGGLAMGLAQGRGWSTPNNVPSVDSKIQALGGAFAGGYCLSAETAPGPSYIQSGWGGSFAFGRVANSSGSTGGISSYNRGSFATGFVRADGANSFIKATGRGSTAHGYVRNQTIWASGNGSLAIGVSVGQGDILASASNSWQFGPGTNDQDSSLSVGTGPRLKGTTGAPTTPRNGDIWVANDYTYIRTNGVSRKIV